jgi:hypothetical protein
MYVTRLGQLQRAGDVLRRMHRFVLVARRLEGQMEDVREEGDGAEGRDVGEMMKRRESMVGPGAAGGEEEGRRERGMNKAALSIAELGA